MTEGVFDFLEAAQRARAGRRVRPVTSPRWQADWYVYAGPNDGSYLMLSKLLTAEEKKLIEEHSGQGPIDDRIAELYYPLLGEVGGTWVEVNLPAAATDGSREELWHEPWCESIPKECDCDAARRAEEGARHA